MLRYGLLCRLLAIIWLFSLITIIKSNFSRRNLLHCIEQESYEFNISMNMVKAENKTCFVSWSLWRRAHAQNVCFRNPSVVVTKIHFVFPNNPYQSCIIADVTKMWYLLRWHWNNTLRNQMKFQNQFMG